MQRVVSPSLILVALIVVICILAWTLRWVQDDAYITFRYSQNMAAGLGPVWNPDYAIEGYSNFTWMLLLAGLSVLGFDIILASQVLGILCFAISLVAIYKIGTLLLPSPNWALLAVALSATNYSFLLYATGGLETQLMAAIVLIAFVLILEPLEQGHLDAWRAGILSGVLAIGVMTRPDGVLLGLILAPVALFMAVRTRSPAIVVSALICPGLIILAVWLVWKLQFYGDILPNTYYAKAAQRTALTSVRGVIYAAWPFFSFLWVLAVGWITITHFRQRKERAGAFGTGLLAILAYVLLWQAYVIWVGGDIMEYRMHVQVIPLIIILLTVATSVIARHGAPVWPLPVLLLAGSALHAALFPTLVRPLGIGTIPGLYSNVDPERPQSWSNIGKALRRDLGSEAGILLAVSPAGAIPYFSGLNTVDILGLNDFWVPKNGYVAQNCTVCQAHARLATFSYLKERNVNLVLGHPQWHVEGEKGDTRTIIRQMFYNEEIDYEEIPPDARLVSIPITQGFKVTGIYLLRSQDIDTLIEKGTWETEEIGRTEFSWLVSGGVDHNSEQNIQ